MSDVRPGAIVRRVFAIYADAAGVLLPTAVALFAVEFVIAVLLPGVVTAIASIIFWILIVFYQGMVVELVRDVEDGRRDHSVADLLSSVRPVFAALLAVSVISGIGIAIGFILLIVPGLILMTIWSVVAPVTVLEHPGVFAAFARSRDLVRGHGWSVFGVILLVYVLTAFFSVVSLAIASGLGHLGRDLVEWAVNVAVAPVTALTSSVLFFALLRAHGEAAAPEPGAVEPL
jgi:hypothetical protein